MPCCDKLRHYVQSMLVSVVLWLCAPLVCATLTISKDTRSVYSSSSKLIRLQVLHSTRPTLYEAPPQSHLRGCSGCRRRTVGCRRKLGLKHETFMTSRGQSVQYKLCGYVLRADIKALKRTFERARPWLPPRKFTSKRLWGARLD